MQPAPFGCARTAPLPALPVQHWQRVVLLFCSHIAVLFTSAAADAPGWLDWASGLHQLHRLRLTAAVTWLQPEEGLAALLPLRRRLSTLRLDGCVLLTDVGAPMLAQLRSVQCLCLCPSS